MLDWKIYYSFGEEITTFSSADGGPEDAPGTGVQVIIVIDSDHGWSTQVSSDYYVWDDKGNGYRWWGADSGGISDYWMKVGQWQKVIRGSQISKNKFNECMAMAMKDPDFPKKTGRVRGERG